jgi:hypothetical protein
MKPPGERIEMWHAVYKRRAGDPRHVDLVALMRDQEDAEAWHCNPAIYVNLARRVRISPAPITVEETPVSQAARAIELLDAIVNGEERLLADHIEFAKDFLKEIRR